jgi:LPPG:FO 2-phospho-L-lactate transferase
VGVGPAVVPMTDDPVRTRPLTNLGWLDFQEYFVHRRCGPVVSQLQFQGPAGRGRTVRLSPC